MLTNKRPYVLSIAGFDPSSGAGLSADIKTFEAHKVYGLSVCTAITYQNDTEFNGVKWISFLEIQNQLEALFSKYQINFVKIGLVENTDCLLEILHYLRNKKSDIYIIWDPILKASAGFEFHHSIDSKRVLNLIDKIDLITPNLPEITKLIEWTNQPIEELAIHCDIFLKGGHHQSNATDYLYVKNDIKSFEADKITGASVHGSGCILSAAICANLALNRGLTEACELGKSYVKKILQTSAFNLAYHYL